MNAKTYTFRILLSTLLVATAVIGFNYYVNPYAITPAERISGFNFYKAGINNHTGLLKKYQPSFGDYNALIVGNSRVEMGISPAHSCFLGEGWRAYNLGMPGAGVRKQLKYALNVMSQQPIKQVLLSLDFTDFLSSSQKSRVLSQALIDTTTGSLEYLPSGEKNPDFLKVMLMDYYKSLFSLDALVSSFKTVARQSGNSADRDSAGFSPARDFAHLVSIEGPRALFSQKTSELQNKYSKSWYLRDGSGRLDQSFDDIEAFLSIAEDKHVAVILFTNPFHESYWDILRNQNLMSMYEDWLKSIERMVRSHGGRGVAMWNFSADSSYIHEAIPGKGLKSGPLKWFWEPAHYRKELGDLMVEAMLSESCSTKVEFGNRVI